MWRYDRYDRFDHGFIFASEEKHHAFHEGDAISMMGLKLGAGLLLCFLTNIVALPPSVNGQRQFSDVPEAIHPAELSGPLPNPYMGWGIWVGRRQFGYSERSFNVQEDTLGFGDDALLFNWVLVDWVLSTLEQRGGWFNVSVLAGACDVGGAPKKFFVCGFGGRDDPEGKEY